MKGSAFLQYHELECAQACVDSVASEKRFIGSRWIRACFSHKQKIESSRAVNVINGERELTESERNFLSRRKDLARTPSHRLPHPISREAQPYRAEVHSLLPGSRIVNMPVRIDADGTMTPLPDPIEFPEYFPQSSFSRSYSRPKDKYDRERRRSRTPPRRGFRSRAASGGTMITCFGMNDKLDVDDIATLFGVYGDVQRVKISPKNANQCWIDFFQVKYAEQALKFMHKIRLFGKDLTVEESTIPPEQLRICQDNEKDRNFRNERARHRFLSRDSEFYARHLCSPSRVLFICHVDPELSESSLQKELKANKVNFLAQLNGKTKSGFVYFQTLEDAVMSMIRNHLKKIGDFSIGLSFSKRRAND